MKNNILQKLSIFVMLLASTFSLHAQFFMTGQNATYVVGQANFTTRDYGTTNKRFWYAYDVAVDITNGKMYVADWWNNRVLRFAYPVTQNDPVADLVFGQSTFTSSTSGTTGNTFKALTGVAVDASGNLWVADAGNHRVLKFNAAYNISTNQPSASVVLGQSIFTSGTSGTALNKMNNPIDMCFDDAGILWVADASNHRVLRFDAANQGTNATANGYLGVGSPNVSSMHMNNPERVVCIGTSLFVADRNNHRVLRFDNAATSTGVANGVLGQANFTTGTQPGVPATQSALRSPSGLAKDASGNLYVSNNDFNRVMIFYNAVAKANGANADVVLGQSSFTSYSYGTTQNGLYNPAGLCFDESNDVLLVSEVENHCVVTFIPPPPPVAPVANPAPAFSTTYFVAEWNASTGATKYYLDVATDAGFTAFVSGYEDLDVGNVLYFNITGLTASTNYFYRVRAYNPSGVSTSSNTIAVTTSPAPAPFFTNGESPTFVVGQPDLTTITPGASILKMSNTSDVVIDTVHGKMYVADMGNHRVLRYHYPISDDNPQFELVFGQPDSVTITSGGPAANKFKTPAALTLDASLNLWVADAGNHRVLKFNAPYSISSNQPNADVVIGQPNFTYTITSGTALDKMNYPRGLCFDNAGNLWVADSKNNRVLRFNAANQGTGATADGYLGDLLGSAASSTNFYRPLDVISMGNFIFVADSSLHRVLRFDDAANKPNAPSASVVLGQINFTTNTPGTTQSKFYGPSGLAKDAAGNLYVSDNVNNRTMIFHHVIAKGNGSNADVELGQINFTGGGAPPLQAAMGYPSGLFFDEKSKVLLVSERYNCRVTLFPINAPEATTALAATAVSRNYFVAKWALSANANKYYLDVATNSTFTSFVSGFQNLVVSNANYLTITGLAAGTDYFYRVRAANPSGTSQNSNTIQVTTGTFVPCLTNGPMAFRVVGQPDFATTMHGTTNQKLWTPNVVVIDTVHGKMYVAERWLNGDGNNRVLRFAYPVTQDYPVAELVFGQPDFTTANPGSCTRNTFNAPRSIAVDASGNLWVVDMYNNRVLKFNAAYSQTTNQPNADVVIGHSDFTTQSQMSTATDLDHLRYPEGIAFDPAGNLWIASTEYHRVLRFNADNLHTGATADGFLGTGAAGTMENQFHYPLALAFIGNSLFVLDANNIRVLRFDNAAGKPNAANADGVLGQTTFYSNTTGYTQNKFNYSQAIGTDAHGRLFVTDGGSDYGRVLGFNDALTKANGANADVVIGSTSFTSRDIYPPSPGYLNFSMGVCYDNQNNLLLVSDNSLHRITFFESCVTNAVTYDANGGAGNVPVDGANPHMSGSTVTVLGNIGTPDPLTKAGYIFGGWNTQANGSGDTYQAGGTFTMPTSAVTLYAIWLPSSTITFDVAGGTPAISPITQAEGTAVTAPASPTKAGFTFVGWSPALPATMPVNDLSVVAQWTPINPQSTITFNVMGGTPTIAPITQDEGTPVTAPASPTKAGFTFAGWIPAVPATMPVDDMTCVAQWTPIVNPQSTINFDVAGGTPAISPITQDEGTPVTAPAFPTKAGFTFAGWIPDVPATMPVDNMTCVAQWQSNTTPGPVIVNATSGTATTIYPTLKEAFDKINDGTHQGAISISITASTTETATASLNGSGTGSASYLSVIIYPTATGVMVGGDLDANLITLDGADNVTFDGRVNMTGNTAYLTIQNNNTGTNAQCLHMMNSAENNMLDFCIVKGSNYLVWIGNSASGNGNDNNKIRFNKFTNANGNRPGYCIILLTAAAPSSDHTEILENHFFDHHRATSFSGAITGGTNFNDVLIQCNSFFETTPLVCSGTSASMTTLSLNKATGGIVRGNYFGGTAPECGGGYFTLTHGAGITAVRYEACQISEAGSSARSAFRNNLITKIDIQKTSASSSSLVNPFYNRFGGFVDVIDNVIGSATATDAIKINIIGGWNLGHSVTAIQFSKPEASDTTFISGNIIGGFTCTCETATSGVSFYGISSSGDGLASPYYIRVVRNNIIGSLTTPNSITTRGNVMIGISGLAAVYHQQIITNNVIANLTNTQTTLLTATDHNSGIETSERGDFTISNNKIYNLKSACENTANGYYYIALAGIAHNAGGFTRNHEICNNQIYNLESTNTGNVAVNVTGIHFSQANNQGFDATTSKVYGNIIHSLHLNSNSPNASLNGISIENYGGEGLQYVRNFYNNIITLGNGVNENCKIYGIMEEGVKTKTNNFWFNTVYIGGTPIGDANTMGLYFAGYGNASMQLARNIQNNLVVNARSRTGGTGKHYAIYFTDDWSNTGTGAALTSNTLNYNNYRVTGTGGNVGCYPNPIPGQPIVDCPTLSDWQTICGQDANSISIDPLFANAGGTASADYIPSATLTGMNGTGITTCYYGTPRTSPQVMGALLHAYTSYQITFNANGGTGGTVQTVTSGVTPTPPTVSKSYHTFQGWSPTIGPATANTTYLAQWQKNAGCPYNSPTFEVTYNANTGTGNVPVDGGSPYAAGATVTVLGNVGTPTVLSKTGSIFSGWNTQAGGGGTTYAAGATFSMPASAVTLYARWLPTSTITFNTAGGSVIAPITQAEGTPVTAPTDPTKAGFTFAGWVPAVPATMPVDDMTCVAQWTPIPNPQSTITFNVMGGTPAISPITQDEGTPVTAPANPTKTGFTFAGWVPAVPATMPVDDMTCVAQWQAITYAITYDANGGTGNVPVDAGSPYATGATITVLGNIGVPDPLSKTCYAFDGWNTQANGSGTTYFAGATFSMPSDAVTLFAIWAANAPVVTANPVNINCFGNNNGAVNITVSSGTPLFTYSWSNSATTHNISGLSAGSYTVTVTDGSGCTRTASATVTGPASPLTATAAQNKPVTTSGGNDGEAIVSAGGGSPGYQYYWNNNQTAITATGLTAGTYTVTVTDLNGCTQTATAAVKITPPIKTDPDNNVTFINVPIPGILKTNDDVPSGTNYSTPIPVSNPSGSTPVINISDEFAGTYMFSSNLPGVYVYNVPVCAPGSPPPPCKDVKLTITVTDPSINTNPPIANTDIAYTLENIPVTLNTLANDAAGNLGGAINPGSVAIVPGTAPNPVTEGSLAVDPTTGKVTFTPVFAFTGVVTYNYQVCDNTSPTPLCTTAMQEITVLSAFSENTTFAADDYQSTPQGQTLTESASNGVLINDNDLEGNTQRVTTTGPITVAGKGTVTINSDGSYTFVPAACYSGPVSFAYTVCDDGTPEACANATLYLLVTPFTATISDHADVVCYGGSNGSATVTLSGGVPAYSYLWINNQTLYVASGLTAGAYTVTITDGDGCIATTSTTITQPAQWWPSLAGPASVCPNSAGNIYTTETGMSDYQWIISPGGTVTAGGTNADQSVTVSWVAAGPQSVSVIYTTPDGCRAVEPKVKDITVNAAPSPVISGATLVPAGTTVEYSTPYIAGHSYSWSANIGNAHPCSLTNNCLRIQWYNPCGLISGVVSVTELDPVTGCSTTATVHVAFTN